MCTDNIEKRPSRRAAFRVLHDHERHFSFHFIAKRQPGFQADLLQTKYLSFPFTGYKVLSREEFAEVCKPMAEETSWPESDES